MTVTFGCVIMETCYSERFLVGGELATKVIQQTFVQDELLTQWIAMKVASACDLSQPRSTIESETGSAISG
jgi:hypothetical protein